MAIKTKPAISRLRLPFFKRLKRRGARASDITDASSDPFILFDRNLNIVGMNPVVRSIFHLILGENVIGEDVPTGAPNMKHDSKNNGRYEKYLNAIRKGKPFFADSIVIHSGLLDINIKAEAFKVGKGFGIIFSDLDALKKAEKTPYDSQKVSATSLQSAPDCIFIFDLKGTILHGSRAGERLTGYAWEEIKGKSYLEIPLFAPEYLPKAAQLVELSASGKPAGPDEFELIRKDGGHVYVEISTCPIGRGDEVEVIAIAHDIMERKQAEEALRQSEERYKAIVETSLDGVYQVDTSGKFTFINESFAKTFGYRQEELSGKHFSSLLGIETFPKVREMVGQVLAGENVRDEVPVQHKDGHKVLVNFSAAPLKDRGKIIGLTGILRDVTKRKQMEEALANSEAKYRSLIETAGAGVAAIDLTGALVLVNEALCRMIGYSQEELLGRNFADFLHPDDKENVLDIFAKGLEGEKEHPVLEFRGIHKNGHSVWCYSSPTPIVQGDEMTGFSAIIHDITERKQMEQALQDSEVKYRNLFNNAQVGLFRTRISDGKQLECNELLAKMVGYDTREECLAEFVTSEHYVDPNIREQMLREIRKEGEVRNFEVQIRRRDGSPFWMSYSARIYPERGYIEGAVVDITERKRVEEALRDSEAKYRSLIETAGAGVTAIDLKGESTLVNEALCRMIGYSQEELQGRSFADFLHPDDKNEVLEIFAKGLAGGREQFHLEFRVIHKDGHNVWCYSTPTAIVDGNELIGFSAIIHDITARKLMEEALRQSEQRLKDAMVLGYTGYWEFDIDTQKIGWSDQTFGLFERDPSLGAPTPEEEATYYSREQAEKLREYARRAVEEGKVVKYDFLATLPSGRSAYMMGFMRPIMDASGRVVKLFGVFHDITERKRVEKALQDSEAKYRSLIETAGAGVATTDLRGDFVLVNEALCKMIGYSQEELLGRSFADFLHPDDKNEVLEIFAKGLAGEREPPHLEFRVIHKDGHNVWCYSTPTAIVDGNELTGFSAIIQDITKRQQAKETLRDSEERFRLILENAPFGYYRVGKDGLWQYVNPAWERMHGFSLEEVIGKPFEITQTKDAVEQSRELVKRALAGESIAGEFSRLRKDGGIEYHSFNIQPVKHGNEIVAIEGFINDITERKKAEQALRQSEERFRNVLDNSLDMVYRLNLQTGRYDYVSPSTEKILGYSPEEFVVFTVEKGRSLAHPDDLGRLDENVIELVTSEWGTASSIEYRIKHKELGYRWVSDSRSVVYDEANNPVAVVGNLRDITDRKKAEEELWRTRERLQLIFDSVQDGVCVTDLEGFITDVNAKGLERYGASTKEEVIGKNAFELVGSGEQGRAVIERQKTLEQGSSGIIEHNVMLADGSGLLAEMNVSLLKDISGNPFGFVAVLRDITERKLMERRLEFLSTIIDQASDGVMVTNLNYEITHANEAAQRMFGYSLEELVGQSPAIFNIEPNAEGMQNAIYQAVSSGKTFLESVLNRRKDGSTFVCEFKVFPMYGNGEIIAYAAFQRDITERKKLEELEKRRTHDLDLLSKAAMLLVELRPDADMHHFLAERLLEFAEGSVVLVNLFDEASDTICVIEALGIGEKMKALTGMLGRDLIGMHVPASEKWKRSPTLGELGKVHGGIYELASGAIPMPVCQGIEKLLDVGNVYAIGFTWEGKWYGSAVICTRTGTELENMDVIQTFAREASIALQRRKVEEALKESEHKFKAIFDNATDGILLVDSGSRQIYTGNKMMCQMLGFSLGELETLGIEDIHPGERLPHVMEQFEKQVRGKSTVSHDIPVKGKDGSVFYADINSSRITLAGKSYLMGIFRDITERKQAEEAVRESERKFRSVLEHSVDVIYQLNLKTSTYDYVSPSSIKALGYSPEELIALGFEKATSVMHPDDTERMKEHFNKLMKRAAANEEGPPTIEYRVKHRESGYRWMGDTSSVLRDDNDVPIAITGNVRDITKRKKAEEALKESEERYRALVDTAGLAGEGIMIVERVEGNKAVIAFVNDTLSGMLGYQREEMLGMAARDLFLPGDRIWLQDKNRKRRKGEALPSHYAVVALRKDESMLPIEISMGAMRYQGRSATVVYVRDVTERKQAEEALRESEAQFRAIFDRAAIGVGLLSIVGQPFKINPALQEMLGYTVEEFHSMAFTDYMHSGDAKLDLKLFREMVAGKRDHYQVEKRFIKKDGQIVWGRVTLSAVRGLGGRLLFAIDMIEDITDSKLALENLRKSEERFRSLTENASEVVLIIDKEGAITYASPSVERILGYKLEEGIGKASFSFIHPDDMPQVMGLFEQMMQNPGGTMTAKVRVQHKDGSWLVAEAIGRNLLDNPAVEGIVVNYRDVTERERAQDELLRHTKQVEALHSVAQLASQTLELEELLSTSLDKVIEVMEAEAGCVYLLDMVEKELVLRTSRGLSDETISRLATIKLNENNIEKIKEWKGGSTPLRKIFEETGLNITAEVKEKEQIQSFAVAPFAVRGQLSGLIAVGNRAYRKFSPGDMDLLRAVGNQIGIGTQNAMLYEEVRALIRETIDAQETERERVCLEVHDGVAQTLVSAFQYLQALEATAPDDAQTKRLLAKTSAQVKQAIQESREVINSLQPATLSDLGLVSTLRHELKRLGQETGLKIDFKADAIRLPKDIETGLYRIIREAVFNARKHANTKQLRVKINLEDERVRVEVRDWGKGFDQAYLDRARKRGTGLFSIRKRAELMKGACEIQSEPGQGTTVRVEIPVSAAERSSG